MTTYEVIYGYNYKEFDSVGEALAFYEDISKQYKKAELAQSTRTVLLSNEGKKNWNNLAQTSIHHKM